MKTPTPFIPCWFSRPNLIGETIFLTSEGGWTKEQQKAGKFLLCFCSNLLKIYPDAEIITCEPYTGEG